MYLFHILISNFYSRRSFTKNITSFLSSSKERILYSRLLIYLAHFKTLAKKYFLRPLHNQLLRPLAPIPIKKLYPNSDLRRHRETCRSPVSSWAPPTPERPSPPPAERQRARATSPQYPSFPASCGRNAGESPTVSARGSVEDDVVDLHSVTDVQ